MAHRSGGGSHSGGHHSSSHHSGHGGGSSVPRYSRTPFFGARRFRYYDRYGTERYMYCDRVPERMSIASMIGTSLFLLPFIAIGIFMIVYSLSSLFPPRPLKPEYKSPDVHILDSADVIDNEDSLEKVLQEFEDLTGISPYIMTVYDSEWLQHYRGNLWEYAYSEYLNTFSDEQHFLIVYSEPENADELEYVEWSWEAIQGDDTDPILTEEHFERFADDLHDDFLRDNISVGKAFENAFRNSLTYMMKGNKSEGSSMGFVAIFWNFILAIFVVAYIKAFINGRRQYQEVPPEGGYAASNAMGMGVPYNGVAQYGGMPYNNAAQYNGGVPYNNATQFNDGTQYNNGMPYNNAAQYNAGMPNGATQYNNGMPNNAAQYNSGMPYNNATQYNTSMPNNAAQYNANAQFNDAAQYNAAGAADTNFYNDDARFRGPEYYDDDARYRGSTAYEAGKK